MSARTLAAATAATTGILATGGSTTTMAVGLAATLIAGTSRRPTASALGHDRALERHLARCRRSEAPASLAIIRGHGAAELVPALRAADSVMTQDGDLVVLADADALDRRAFEDRLTGDLHCAWAAFPTDGLTLTDLLAVAEERLEKATAPAPLTTKGSLSPVSLFPLRRRPLADGSAA